MASPAIMRAREEAHRQEKTALLAVLIEHGGNQTKAAAAYGVSLATFKRRLAAAGLTASELRERWPLAERQSKKST